MEHDANILNEDDLIINDKIEFKLNKFETFEKLVYDTTTFYIGFLGKASLSDIRDQIYNLGQQIKNEVDKGMEAILEILSYIEIGNKFVSHSLKVTIFSVFIANSVGISEQKVDDIIVAALLHDVGKLKLPNKFAYSSIASNYKDKKERFYKHPSVGYSVVREDLRYPEYIAKMVLNHHEQLDGQGFPNKLNKAQLAKPDRVLFTANFIDNVLRATEYSGLKKMIATLESAFNKYPGKFDGEIVVRLFSTLKENSRIDRKHDRFNINKACFYKYKLGENEKEYDAILIDLSEGGARINNEKNIEIGNYIYLSFNLGAASVLNIRCIVMRTDQIHNKLFSSGLKFVELTDSQKSAIFNFLNDRKNTRNSIMNEK